MWTKDVYQEQMLAYLDEVEADIEQFMHSRSQPRDLNELYADLDMTFRRLWRLVGANDGDWEDFRSPVEISCDRLQRAFYRIPSPDVLPPPTSRTMTGHHERRVELWETAGVL